MNDGVAILMFELFHEFVVASGDEEHEHGSIGSIALHVCAKFAQIAFGGPVWGWIIGRITIFLLSYVYNDVPVEISATLCASYLTYWSSEYVLGSLRNKSLKHEADFCHSVCINNLYFMYCQRSVWCYSGGCSGTDSGCRANRNKSRVGGSSTSLLGNAGVSCEHRPIRTSRNRNFRDGSSAFRLD